MRAIVQQTLSYREENPGTHTFAAAQVLSQLESSATAADEGAVGVATLMHAHAATLALVHV